MVQAYSLCLVSSSSPSQVLAEPFEERVPHLALRRLRSVFDLGKQLGLDPDAAMGDPLAVGLLLTDQWRQARSEGLGALAIEAKVDLAGIDQVGAFAPADIKAIPFVAVQRESGDRQRLALRASDLDPVVRSSASIGT